MENLQFVRELIQEFENIPRIQQPLSWEEKCIQKDFDYKLVRPKYNHASWVESLRLIQGNSCQICSMTPTDCHHVLPVELYPELAEDTTNGIILCLPCHQKVHKMLQYKGFVTRSDFNQVFNSLPMPLVEGYTVEELAKLSGYSVKTIYNLTAYGVLRPPSRGVDPTKYRSKGLYSLDTLDKLKRFTELKNCGRHKKDRIILIMKQELQEEEAIICQ